MIGLALTRKPLTIADYFASIRRVEAILRRALAKKGGKR
jgi:hypothetical protein